MHITTLKLNNLEKKEILVYIILCKRCR